MEKISWVLLYTLIVWNFAFGSSTASASPGDASISHSKLPEATLASTESDLSLSEVLDLKVTVFGNGAVSNREAPAITSIITREEILNIGARDLQEVLNILVPGYSFGSYSTFTALAIRGFEAFTGRILLLIDGVEKNDGTYTTVWGGNHYNLDNVKQIEIIRGPGSAVYGRSAELTVVNVISRDPSQNAVYGTAANSQMSHTFGQRGGTVGFAKKVGDFYTDMSFTNNLGNLSQLKTVDPGTNKDFSTLHHSQLNLQAANFNVGYKELSFRANYIKAYKEFYWNGPFPDGSQFGRTNGYEDAQYTYELKYNLPLSRSFKLMAKVLYKKDLASQNDVVYTLGSNGCKTPYCAYPFHTVVNAITGQVSALWNITDSLDIVSGVETYDSALYWQDPNGPYVHFYSAFKHLPKKLASNALFSQGTWYTPYVNITLGARYDTSKSYAPAFVPRIALTKAFERFQAKVLASQGYLIPGVAQLTHADPASRLRPEKATSLEGQLGYKFTDQLWAAANYFDISVKKPIVYDANNLYYTNFGFEGTRGSEFQLKYKSRYFDGDVNYSNYTGDKKNDISIHLVPKSSGTLLAAPRNKASLITTFKPIKHLFIVPYILYIGKRYYLDQSTPPNTFTVAANTYYNINVRYEDLFVPGLEVSLGVRDITDRGTFYQEIENSGLAPTPGPSRSFTAQLTYSSSL